MPFKKVKKDPPGITTASLPDIVFMLLCFFIVVTKMRDAEIKVRVKVPQATELQKLEKKTLVSHIFVGPPIPAYQGDRGTAPQIQLNDAFSLPTDIPLWVAMERSKVLPIQHGEMTAAMRVDSETKMGIITEIKTELRKQDFRKVSYLANKRSGNL